MNLLLRRAGMDVRAVNTLHEMTQRLSSDSYDLILLDGGTGFGTGGAGSQAARRGLCDTHSGSA
jgi:DNA-binding response OmpR family regulator